MAGKNGQLIPQSSSSPKQPSHILQQIQQGLQAAIFKATPRINCKHTGDHYLGTTTECYLLETTHSARMIRKAQFTCTR